MKNYNKAKMKEENKKKTKIKEMKFMNLKIFCLLL
jgi:hypothetical protein